MNLLSVRQVTFSGNSDFFFRLNNWSRYSLTGSIQMVALLTSLLGASFLSAQVVSGNIYKDFAANGTKNTSGTIIDVGLAGVVVNATNSAGAALTVTYGGGGSSTNSTGTYSVTSGTLGQIRLEFVLPDGYTYAANGNVGGTTVMFPTTSTQNLAVQYPAEYCQASPNMVTPIFINGRPSGGAGIETMARFPYSASGGTLVNTYLATAAQIGSVWGLAYNKSTQEIYAGSFLKRHVGLKDHDANGTEDLGIIYKMTTSGSPVVWLNMASLGIDFGESVMPTISSRALPASNSGPSRDGGVFGLIDAVGIGDVEISDDNQKLYVVNLFDKKVYTINIADKTIAAVSNAVPTCTGGQARPYALKYHKGNLYVGSVCDASVSNLAADLDAIVYRMDGANFTSILNFGLDYAKGPAFSDGGHPWGTPYGAQWYPWVSSFNTSYAFLASTGLWGYVHPQPVFADIEFDVNDAMIMVFDDRTGDQIGTANFQPNTSDNNLYYGIAGGDLLRASLSGSTYVLESNGSSGGVTTTGAGNGQGPGGGEYYQGDFTLSSWHADAVQGGGALLPGSGQIAVHVVDPIDPFAGGPYWFNNTTGSSDRAYQVFTPTQYPPTFGKANGVGDLELLCNLAPIEIGNRVWEDTDNDGIQDAGEPAISGVQVDLCLASAPTTVVASATTSTTGQYFFSSGTGTGSASAIYSVPISFNTAYILKFPLTTGTKVLSTLPNQGSNDVLDTDADAAGKIMFTTGYAGENNHSYDVGYREPPPCLIIITATPTLCIGTNSNTYALSGTLTITGAPSTGTLTVSVPGGASEVFTAPFAASINYTIDKLVADGVSRTVTATFSAGCSASTSYTAPSAVGSGFYSFPVNSLLSDAYYGLNPHRSAYVDDFHYPGYAIIDGLTGEAFDLDLSPAGVTNLAGFCVELEEPFGGTTHYNNEFRIVPLENISRGLAGNAGTTSLNIPVGGIGKVRAGMIRYLFDQYYVSTDANTWTNNQAAAFQYAVWEITHEVYSSNNSFSISTASANGFYTTSTFSPTIVNLTNSYLSAINTLNWTDAQWMSYESTTYHVFAAENNDNPAPGALDYQDFLFAQPVICAACVPPSAPVLSVTNNTCSPVASGSINVTTGCGAGSHIEYSTNNGGSWSTTAPTYGASSITVIARCVLDSDNTCVSSSSTPITTMPVVCCDITSIGSSRVCNDNSTGTPTDDYYIITLNPTGTGIGSQYNISIVHNGTTYNSYGVKNYGVATVLPTHFLISGGAASVTVTDATTGTCSLGPVSVSAPATCSTCNITSIGATAVCNDNGTGTPTDDYFRLTLNPVGTGIGTQYNVSVVHNGGAAQAFGPFTYGAASAQFGNFPISGGAASVTVTDATTGTCSLGPVSVSAPATCSTCNITSIGATAVCNDNGTGTPTDDYFRLTLNPVGTGIGTQYNVSVVHNGGAAQAFGPFTYGAASAQFGNFPISGGAASVTVTDATTGTCSLGPVSVNAPATCSTCNITSIGATAVCNDNGTGTPTDDYFRLTLNPVGTGIGTQYNVSVVHNGGAAQAFGPFTYGAASAQFGNFPISGGAASVTVTDATTGTCSLGPVSVNAPATCSTCNITSIGATAVCNDNGTGTASDDYFRLTLNPVGMGIGTQYNVSVVHNGGAAQAFGPFTYGAASVQFGNFPISGGAASVTVTDATTGTCSLGPVSVSAPATCSTCNITSIGATAVCNDNGTGTPTDDYFRLTLNPVGTGIGTQYNVSVVHNGGAAQAFGPFTYGAASAQFGNFPISGGAASVTVTDATTGTCSLGPVSVSAPATCSTCNITSIGATAVCNDNGTGTPTDDYFRLTLNPVGTGIGTQYNVNVVHNGGAAQAFGPFTYGAASAQFGNFPISGGAASVTVTDATTGTCSLGPVSVSAPATCSTCNITSIGATAVCNDNGTGTPTDDYFRLTLNPVGTGIGTQYNVSVVHNGGAAQAFGPFTYGAASAQFGNFPISGGAASVTVTDATTGTCSLGPVSVSAPATCSTCNITSIGATAVCNDNGTGTPTDDYFRLTLNPVGTGIGTQYNVSVVHNGGAAQAFGPFTYGAASAQFGNFPISGGAASVTVTDATTGTCSLGPVSVNAPATCSTCNITSIGATAVCNDNGTGTPTDDYFRLTLNPVGTGIGTQYNVSVVHNGGAAQAFGPFTYGAASAPFGNFPISGGAASVTVTDATTGTCSLGPVSVSAPATCSTCNITSIGATAVCNDNGTGTPTDDYFRLTLNPVGTGIGTQYNVSVVHNGGAAQAFGPFTYGAASAQFGNFPISGGAASVTVTDATTGTCSLGPVSVNAPATCSTCNITSIGATAVCNDNGTGTPTDDYFRLTLNPVGTGIGTQYNVSVVHNGGAAQAFGPFTYGAASAQFGNFPISGGAASVTVTDATTGTCSLGPVSVSAPATCSTCSITSIGATATCNDNGTGTALDDYFRLTLNPVGMGIGTQYNVSVVHNGGAAQAFGPFTYGAASAQFGNFPISGGAASVTVTDATTGTCSLGPVSVSAPATCSTCPVSAATFIKVPGNCTGVVENNNGRIILSATTGSPDKYGIVLGGSYGAGPSYAAATAIGALPLTIQTAIPNTGATYTVRIFNGANDCYIDYVVVVPISNCPNDPMGYIYCEDDGSLVTGGTIAVSPPAGATYTITSDGSTGFYQLFTDGTPGIYTISYTPPSGYALSASRLPAGTLDATGQPNPYLIGSNSTNGTTLDNYTAAANPYYFVIDLASGDPEILLNNIPLTGCCTAPVLTTQNASICSGSTVALASLVTGNTPFGTLSFHTTLADANAGVNALVNTNVSPAMTTTYFVRSEVAPTCYSTASMAITVVATPSLVVTNGSICSGGSINLATLVTSTGGGTLSYYTTLSNAVNATSPLVSTVVSPSAATSYYIRSQNSTDCYDIKKVVVTLLPTACGPINSTGPN